MSTNQSCVCEVPWGCKKVYISSVHYSIFAFLVKILQPFLCCIQAFYFFRCSRFYSILLLFKFFIPFVYFQNVEIFPFSVFFDLLLFFLNSCFLMLVFSWPLFYFFDRFKLVITIFPRTLLLKSQDYVFCKCSWLLLSFFTLARDARAI